MRFLDSNVNVDVNGIVKQVGEAIGQINQAAQPVVMHAWEVYVRQQLVSGIDALVVNGLFMISLIVAGAIFLPKLFRWARDYKYDDPGNDGTAYLLPSILSALFAIAFIVIIHNISDAILQVLNPEYYAFQQILSQISSVGH